MGPGVRRDDVGIFHITQIAPFLCPYRLRAPPFQFTDTISLEKVLFYPVAELDER
jgi:hypothetical protein